MFETPIVTFGVDEGVSLLDAQILVDDDDYAGVRLAASNLAKDFRKVVLERQDGSTRKVVSRTAIIIGTLSRSPIIQHLKKTGQLDTSKIEGKWESWMTAALQNPGRELHTLRGFDNALIIAGSDKRGAIFGTYSLSEQIGVSPWYWWADVPVKKHENISVLPGVTYNGEPSVKYRGIFINDECPAMDSWVHEKFGPKFDSSFYSHVFELLLRLKANFLWPGMWRGYPYPGRSFFVDDPENQRLAHRYGIVIGTSHHEPMQRAMNEWSTNQPEGTWNWQTNKDKVREYFVEGAERAVPYESYITLGMRAEGDSPISGDKPIDILKDVLANQREIIKDKYGNEDGEMQLIALYKEVQQYYEDGLEIPDDVTLLFADDNFGSLRRLPTKKELKRKGGIGFYYHFEYTGSPRSYRWMNSNCLGKTLHQLKFAYEQGARQIWIFNVGDLKPQELPMSFAFDLAWDINRVNHSGLRSYFHGVATREFGRPGAIPLAEAWYEYDRLIALRKHEHIEPESFVLLKHHEADTIVARWKNLLDRVESLYQATPESHKPAFFQLVLYPIKASYIYVSLRVTQYRNRLFAKQRRNMTNVLFHKCIEIFDSDLDLVQEYHSLLGGKWNHIMRQPHYGYTSTGMAPSRDMISGLCYVQTRADSNPSVGHMGVAVEGTEGVNPGLINEDSDRTHPSRRWLEQGVTLPYICPYGPQTRYMEIFHRGTKAFDWSAKPQYDWIKLSSYKGHLEPTDQDSKIIITIDWASVPAKFDEETYIEIFGSVDGYEKVHLPVKNRKADAEFHGFVESNGYVSIDAGNWVPKEFLHLPAMGRPLAGCVTLPRDAKFDTPGGLAVLRYPMYVFSSRDDTALELQFSMTLETDPDSRMEYDVRWDGGEATRHRLTEDGDELPRGWRAAVQDCCWVKRHNLGWVEPGAHVLEVRMRKPNMCLEKVVVDLGGLLWSYLGPPESNHVESNHVESVGGSPRRAVVDEMASLRINLSL